MQTDLDTEQLIGEVDKLKQQLDDANRAREKSVEQIEQLTRRAAEDKAEIDQLRGERKSFLEDASRFSREDDRQIRLLQREKQESETKIARLKSEVAELRSVIQQYVGEISSTLDTNATSALHSELALVRQQAESDVNEMREQLKARELHDSAGLAELNSLREEFDSLQRNDENYREALADAERERQRLREQVEEQRGEAQRLERALNISREELEKVEERRRSQVEQRQQLEAQVEALQNQLTGLHDNQDTFATDLRGSAIDPGVRGAARRNSLLAAVIAAVGTFLAAEAISLMRGSGELITGMAGERWVDSETVFPPAAERQVVRRQLDLGAATVSPTATEEDPALDPKKQPALPVGSGPVRGTTLRDPLRSGARGPVMVKILGGRFNMGQNRNQLVTDERPQHRVEIAGFALGKFEVTFDEYLLFARATGREMPSDQGWGRGQRPVVDVSWKDATAYTLWLSAQTGRSYRLPTEAEWEYAAGGGEASFFWWGYALGENRASCFDCGSRWDGVSTAPVGSFPANPHALHDTAGNVLEWVADCYHENYQGAPLNGSAWQERDCTQRVARGGAYNKPGDSLHTTRRFHFQPTSRLPILGFRVARDLE